MGFREDDHGNDLENDVERFPRLAERWSELLELRAIVREAEAAQARWKKFGGRPRTIH